MGKKVSWFNSVKKVFRSSSSKDNEKKKATPHRWQTDAPEPVLPTHFPSQSSPRRAFAGDTTPLPVVAVDEGRIRAVAVAMATAAAAAEVDRLATVGRQSRGDQAAILIQSVYRGYLARRALRALKGLVRLQALVRGHNVRKQAQVTMRCMQALVRVQARVRARRVLIAQQKNSNKFEHVQGDHYVDHDDGDGDGDYDDDGIDDYPPSLEVDSWDGRHHRREGVRRKTFHRKHNAVIEREKELAYAYAQQPWHPESSYGENFSAADSGKTQWGWNWLDSWISSRPYDARHVAPDGSYFTATHTDDMSEKTVEMDIARSASYVDAGNQRNPVKNFRRPPGLSPEREVSSSHVSAGKDIPAVRVVVPTPSYMATTHSSMAKARADVPHRHAPSLAYTCKRPPKRVGSTGDSSSSGGGSGSGVLGSQMQQRSSSTKGVGGIRVRTHGFTGYNADSSGGEERTPPSSGTDHHGVIFGQVSDFLRLAGST